MERIPSSAPKISAIVSSSADRPMWSVMIPVYNCSKFLSDTLLGVLEQDPGEAHMQIEVVDDASTDADVEAIVKDLGKGRVAYYRQPVNVGSLRNFETCINRSKGKLIHLLHGDDCVKPGFYKKMEWLFQQYPEAGAAFTNYSFINEEGIASRDYVPQAEKEGVLDNWLIRIAEYQRIQYAAMVVRREVYETLGSFYGTTYGEDWEMWVRIAKHYPVAYSPEVLAKYRAHSGSLTWEKAVEGKIFQDLVHTMNTIQKHVPLKERKRVLAKAKKHCAHYLIGTAINMWNSTNDVASINSLIKQSLAFNKDAYIISRILKLYFKVIIKKAIR